MILIYVKTFWLNQDLKKLGKSCSGMSSAVFRTGLRAPHVVVARGPCGHPCARGHCVGDPWSRGTLNRRSAGSPFHHWRPKTEKSCAFADGPLLALSDGGTRRPAEVVERRDRAGVCDYQCLEVGRGSSIDRLVCQHHHLESDASYNREPVEVPEEGVQPT